MKIILSHISAVSFWGSFGSPDAYGGTGKNRCQPSNERYASSQPPEHAVHEELERLGLAEPDEVIHLLVRTESARRNSKLVKCHTYPEELPPGSLFAITDEIFVCSPALTFELMAATTPIPKLAALGATLCSIYATAKNKEEVTDYSSGLPIAKRIRRLHERDPIATKAAISRHLDLTRGTKGIARARRALEYVAERSRSPMETALYLHLCLPSALGGYGLPMPTLNFPVAVPIATPYYEKTQTFICDLFWPKYNISLEYLGGIDHTGQINVYRDSVRSNALKGAGITQFTATKEQLFNLDQLHSLAMSLSKSLRIRYRCKRKDFKERQRELKRILFNIALTTSRKDARAVAKD